MPVSRCCSAKIPSRHWTRRSLRRQRIKTFPSETYFFLADVATHDAAVVAARLRERKILIKPLNDPALGRGYMRVTTALPEDSRRFLDAIRAALLQT